MSFEAVCRDVSAALGDEWVTLDELARALPQHRRREVRRALERLAADRACDWQPNRSLGVIARDARPVPGGWGSEYPRDPRNPVAVLDEARPSGRTLVFRRIVPPAG